jgi:hypothetical protein
MAPWIPLRPFPSEAAMAEYVLAELSGTFRIQREVRGEHCSGKPLRLDTVLRPRDPSGWRDESPVFGVEFKESARTKE